MQLRRLLIIMVFLLGVWHWMPLKAGVVRGESMEPTLRNGQFFVLDRSFYQTHRVEPGDIVAFRHEGKVYVKRVHAVAGQVVWELRSPDAPNVLADPARVAQIERITKRLPGLGHVYGLHVPTNEVYVLGDAYAVSLDSRHLGTIPVSEIIGKVLV